MNQIRTLLMAVGIFTTAALVNLWNDFPNYQTNASRSKAGSTLDAVSPSATLLDGKRSGRSSSQKPRENRK